MNLWAIVPVKALRRGKSRLAGVLSENDREILNQSLLKHTMFVLRQVPEIQEILVVSSDTAVLALARENGARTVLEDGNPGLNTALKRATKVAQLYSAQGILIVPSDLPLITKSDIDEIVENAQTQPIVVIAPGRRNEGTNALLLKPPGLIDYQFGEQSFQKHTNQTEERKIPLIIINSPTLGLDLDYPEDLELLQQYQTQQINL